MLSFLSFLKYIFLRTQFIYNIYIEVKICTILCAEIFPIK